MVFGFLIERLNLPYLQGDLAIVIGLISLIITKAKAKAQAKAKMKAKAKIITKAKAKAIGLKGLKGLKQGRKENHLRIRAEGLLTALTNRNQNMAPVTYQKIRP